MIRLLIAALVALFAVAGAQAKAPPDGVDICGTVGACVHLTWQQAEPNWALWSWPTLEDSVRPSAVAPFLLVHWQWPGEGQKTAYYVPATGKIRQTGGGAVSWFKLADATGLPARTASLTPFPVPQLTRVTVGGRSVRDPQSYLEVFGAGVNSFTAILPRWLPIKFFAFAPSPWTDGVDEVWISRKGGLLWIDGNIVRIPLQLAQRIRARRSLAP